jgi:chromosome partition protein MukE
MTRPGYAQLQDVLMDADFPELDLALRRGRHVDRDDVAWYALLGDAQEHLEAFYRRYGCELIHKADGYYYLLPTGDKLSRRQLGAGDMVVGQALALLYLHPSTVERAGLHTVEEVIAQLAAVMGNDALIRAFNPKRRRYDERVAQKNVRSRVGEAIRRLAQLGFAELGEEDQLRLRPALLRFAEPVRGLSEPAEALAQLVARGEVSLSPDGEGEGDLAGAAPDDEGDLADAASDDEPDDDGPVDEDSSEDEDALDAPATRATAPTRASPAVPPSAVATSSAPVAAAPSAVAASSVPVAAAPSAVAASSAPVAAAPSAVAASSAPVVAAPSAVATSSAPVAAAPSAVATSSAPVVAAPSAPPGPPTPSFTRPEDDDDPDDEAP